MPHFALHYDLVENFVQRRMPFREEHLRQLRDLHDRGVVVMAGALGDPPDGALLVFRGDSPAAADEFARTDPYVRQGLVTSWRVRPWHVVIGGDAPQAL
jgi:uncharacterized protein YciI